ncbi:DUF6572 domain-containing protein [Nocardia amikacinitolerans]|uniref:DUF6572 domain-containing protein n=1 Tax=Nocardia amikacinitolerans TaxID=756689 RepID=UPI0036C53BCD
MSVSEHDRIDQIFVSPEGRLVLAMSEERPYRTENSHVLDEDFRNKINSYIHAARVGHAHRLAHENGVAEVNGIDIVLYSRTHPSPAVLRLIGRVNEELSAEGIGARWESIASEDLGVEVIERALVNESVRLVGSDWKFALMWVTLIGRDGAAGIQVEHRDGSIVNVRASEGLLALLSEHKRAFSDFRLGTWLSGQILIKGDHTYKSQFSNSDVPEWMPQPTADNLRAELDMYPREAGEVPVWVTERIRSAQG